MTTDEALEELRKMQNYRDETLMLAPNTEVSNGIERQRFDVVDAYALATVIFDGGYEESIIASGPTPASAIEAAREKLEGK